MTRLNSNSPLNQHEQVDPSPTHLPSQTCLDGLITNNSQALRFDGRSEFAGIQALMDPPPCRYRQLPPACPASDWHAGMTRPGSRSFLAALRPETSLSEADSSLAYILYLVSHASERIKALETVPESPEQHVNTAPCLNLAAHGGLLSGGEWVDN